MRSNIIAKTREEWEYLASIGDLQGLEFMKLHNITVDRVKQRYPLAFSKEEMQPKFVEAYQKLADFLGEKIYCTGSVLRGYWRTKEEEDEIAVKYDTKPKYSDFDFWLDRKIDKEEIKELNDKLKPIAPYSYATWERSVEFYPKNK
ncbi:MAG TPA: hypothetical protein P5513_07165 [Candidatus Diapherotrites archaeon]|nr:hypothetical protein [Candidatus Dojkabacteria bacterium]HRT03702.1 hypothetical protein [Candidatus Diapherotrites archaeon]